MDRITIRDNKQLLLFAADDLKAIRSMILTVGDHEEYANAYEALKVIDRALLSIINDIQEAIDGIDTELKKGQYVQQKRNRATEAIPVQGDPAKSP